MKTFLQVRIFWALFMALMLIAGTSHGEEDGPEKYDDYNARVYGEIEKNPAGGKEGIWVVNEREIHVTGTTVIDEEYGRAEVGAYVEITGNYEGREFTAYKIEVRMGKKGD